jgi:putative ABC transport system ATP-binding protein
VPPAAPPGPPSTLFAARGLRKTYRLGEVEVGALRGIDLDVAQGEAMVVCGPSGSGKSTLLNLLGTIDEPDAGSLLIAGLDARQLGSTGRTLLRRRTLGFVFQTFNLLPVLSALENVEYPLWIDGVPGREARRRAAAALAAVGLEPRQQHRPDQLSGGERQRVAIARALVHEPRALLADEPTGNLDSVTGGEILTLFERLHRERGTTVIIATHDPSIIASAQRVVRLQDGLVVADERRSAPLAKGPTA